MTELFGLVVRIIFFTNYKTTIASEMRKIFFSVVVRLKMETIQQAKKYENQN